MIEHLNGSTPETQKILQRQRITIDSAFRPDILDGSGLPRSETLYSSTFERSYMTDTKSPDTQVGKSGFKGVLEHTKTIKNTDANNLVSKSNGVIAYPKLNATSENQEQIEKVAVDKSIAEIEDELNRIEAKKLADKYYIHPERTSPTGHEERPHDADGAYELTFLDPEVRKMVGSNAAWSSAKNPYPSSRYRNRSGKGMKRKLNKI